MKNSVFTFCLISFILIGCNLVSTKDQVSNEVIPKDEKASTNSGKKYWEEIVMHKINDQKGQVWAEMPFPASWNLGAPDVAISGPNNIRVKDFPAQSFMINYDPSLAYAYSQTPMRELPSIDELIQQDLVPYFQQNGFNYVKNYELPEVAKIQKWYDDQLFKVGNPTSIIKVYGIDLTDNNGNPAFYILRLNCSTTQSLRNWYYLGSLLQADPKVFELAKKQYLFGLSNMRFNLEPIKEYNEAEANRIGQSWAAFNQRMAANQRAFEAQQAAHINKSNAINDAIMGAYNSRMESMDRTHEKTIDGIYERENVQNPETGQTYKVEQGYNRYWMNNNGEYIATPQQNFDPNTVQGLNESNWQELNKVK